MKKIHILWLLTLLGLTACKKNNVQPAAQLTSFNVTNAVIGGDALTLNTSQNVVYSDSYSNFTLTAGQTKIYLYSSTGQPYYNQTLTTADGSYYSLFLTGTSPTTVAPVLIKESYKNYTDSLFGVRFINLSPDSPPISVNQSGNGSGSEVNSLAYKSCSNFKQYASKHANSSYSFEIRDAASGILLTTYTFSASANPIPYFHNVTIALTGLQSDGSFSTLTVNHFQ